MNSDTKHTVAKSQLFNLDEFFKNCNINKPNSILRKLVNERREEEIAPKFILDELCAKMLDIAIEGLVSRGKGEEALLK